MAREYDPPLLVALIEKNGLWAAKATDKQGDPIALRYGNLAGLLY